MRRPHGYQGGCILGHLSPVFRGPFAYRRFLRWWIRHQHREYFT